MIKLSDYELNDFVNKVYELSKSGECVLVEMYGFKMHIMPNSSMSLVRITILSKLKSIREREINLHKLIKLDEFSEEKIFEMERYTPDYLSDVLRSYTQYENIGHSKK